MFIFVLLYILLGPHNPPQLRVCNVVINHILDTLYMVRKHTKHVCYCFFSYSIETLSISVHQASARVSGECVGLLHQTSAGVSGECVGLKWPGATPPLLIWQNFLQSVTCQESNPGRSNYKADMLAMSYRTTLVASGKVGHIYVAVR